MKSYVLFDVNYLSYRAFYTTGTLANMGDPTGVLYGVLREIQTARERFAAHKFVFCFDHGKGKREEVMGGYKATRRNRRVEDEEAAALDAPKSQVKDLKMKYLERIGYNNVLYQSGYEADDIIASLCKNNLGPTDKAVIYSDDKDLYQLLTTNVSMWKPRTQVLYTAADFVRDYGISPVKWAKVKAIAGCSSDDVPGIPGVGEKTAVQYIKGELKVGSVKRTAIEKGRALWKPNLPIVRLPFEGTKVFELAKDVVTSEKWDAVASSLGMDSLTGDMPPAIVRKPLLKV